MNKHTIFIKLNIILNNTAVGFDLENWRDFGPGRGPGTFESS
jgi:hypothetical protein